MTIRKTHIVRIDNAQPSKPLSKAQKQFNTLSKKIEKLRAQLIEWQQDFPAHYQELYGEFSTLKKSYNHHRFELVRLFDLAQEDKAFKRQEKKKLKHLILSIVDDLMVDQPSDELEALHDKYSDISYGEKKNQVDDVMRSMMGDLFGFDIDDDTDVSSLEELFASMEAKEREENERVRQQNHNRKRGGRKQTAKQAAREARLKAEQQETHKSFQAVYRKLAAALHPDREPDAAERARKTELMQRANVAYNKKDLLQLMEIQLEIEQVDRSHINAISDQNLRHYIKVLKEQCRELEQAIIETQMAYGLDFAMSNSQRLSTKRVKTEMNRDIKELRRNVEQIEGELNLFENPAYLKTWLQLYRIPPEPDMSAFMDFAMADEFIPFDDDDFFDLPETEVPKKKKRKKRKKATKRASKKK